MLALYDELADVERRLREDDWQIPPGSLQLFDCCASASPPRSPTGTAVASMS